MKLTKSIKIGIDNFLKLFIIAIFIFYNSSTNNLNEAILLLKNGECEFGTSIDKLVENLNYESSFDFKCSYRMGGDNNIYARMEYGMIDYTDNPDGVESSSGYYVDLGYDFASLIGCDDDTNLYLWMRTSSYSRDDEGDPKDILLVGVTYKPTNNISFKLEAGTAGDDDVMRLGLGYMF